jgi:hypothetical protein
VPNLAKQSEWDDDTILLTTSEVGYLILQPSAHTCHSPSSPHLAEVGQVTAAVRSKNIVLFLLFFSEVIILGILQVRTKNYELLMW